MKPYFDEYDLILANNILDTLYDPALFLEKIKKIALKHKVKLNPFAKAVKGKYTTDCKNHHF